MQKFYTWIHISQVEVQEYQERGGGSFKVPLKYLHLLGTLNSQDYAQCDLCIPEDTKKQKVYAEDHSVWPSPTNTNSDTLQVHHPVCAL